MFHATYNAQVYSLFGGGYVSEQHADERGNLAPRSDTSEVAALGY